MFQAVQYQLGFIGLRRVQRCLWTHLSKPLVFPKNHNKPHVVRRLWCQTEHSFEYSKDLAAIKDSSFYSDLLLHYSIGACAHIFLGTIIYWKLDKQFLPTNSTEAEVRTFYAGTKRTK